MTIAWDAYTELNAARYVIYRGTSINQLVAIASIETDSTTFLDNNGLVNGQTYYYAVGIIDWGNVKGPRTSPPLEVQVGDLEPPAAPIGVGGHTENSPSDGTYIDISWTANSEDDLEGYNIYLVDSYNEKHRIGTVTAI